MSTINHPLPVGTRVYYEDLDGGDGTVTHNDPSSSAFAAAVAAFNQQCKHPDSPVGAEEMDYIVDFDDVGPLPVQAGGILRVL